MMTSACKRGMLPHLFCKVFLGPQDGEVYTVPRFIHLKLLFEGLEGHENKRKMKRLSLLLLMCFVGYLQSKADIQRNITAQLGVPFSVSPVSDLGLNDSQNPSAYNLGGKNNLVKLDGEYYISDPEAFAISPTAHTTHNFSDYTYYDYTFTPTKIGSYSFYQYIDWNPGRPTESAKVTYVITVVDLTNISIPSNMELSIGDTYTFTPILSPTGVITTLTWLSSNTSVATIDSNGTLLTNGIGSTTITCMGANGVSATCEVVVNAVQIKDISFDKPSAELTTGEQLQLTANIQPSNASNKSLTWSSSNETVAVVNESGLVTAVGSGMCNITAATKDGSELTASCLVTVLGNVLYCEDFGAVQGAIVTIPIQLKNADAIQGFEFELVLPEGVSVEADENGKLKAALTDRVSTTGLDGAQLSNGNYKFVFTSTNRLLGNEGAVVNVPIVVAEGVAIGTYDVVVKNVELVKYGTSAQIHHADRTATLTVNAMTLGDVNGDGRISVADAISIINYALGRTPVSFVTRAADVNGDGDISLADAVAVVDIILGRNGSNVKAAELLPMSEPE